MAAGLASATPAAGRLAGNVLGGASDRLTATAGFGWPAAGSPGAASAENAHRLTDVRRLLDRRASALLHRNRAGWLAGLDPRSATLRARQAAVFDNLASVPLASWRWVLATDYSRPLGAAAIERYRDAVWAPAVTLRYALRGVDAEPTERPQVLTFVHRAGRWYLAADTDVAADGTRSWRGLWDFGPVVARRGRLSLVLAHPRHANRLEAFARSVDAAVPAVVQVWGPGWRSRVAVLIPDSQQEMAALVGQRFAFARIAAVAVADYVDTSTSTAQGQRVVVNPANLDRLGQVGRTIVLRHEITHLVTRSATAQEMPTWLVEGFADYVGYLQTGLPASVVAPDVVAAVRRGRWPARLPADQDFRADSARLGVAYQEAWLACRLVARRAGQGGLVRLYRLVGATANGEHDSTPGAPGGSSAGPDGAGTGADTSAGTGSGAGPEAGSVHGGPATGPDADVPAGSRPLDAALRQVTGLSLAQFTAQWRATVRTELG